MGLDESSSYRQTYPAAAVLARARRIDAIEAIEDSREVFGRDARAGIPYGDPEFAFSDVRRHRDSTIGRSVVYGVADEIR